MKLLINYKRETGNTNVGTAAGLPNSRAVIDFSGGTIEWNWGQTLPIDKC